MNYQLPKRKFLMSALTLLALTAFSKSPLELCRVATQLDCDAMSQKDLESLKRMCTDPTKTLSVWGGYGIGQTEKQDEKGSVSLVMNYAKQGSANGRTPCTTFKAYRYPQTEDDVVTAVLEAKRHGWKIRAAGAAHTDNELICGDGMAMSNRFMNKIFLETELFEGVDTVRAEPGVTIRQLGEWLHQRHKSIGFAIVGFEAVTLGGVIGTGAHGSSLVETAMLSDIIQSLRLVHADGKIREYTQNTTGKNNPELWQALILNLGMMGFVTEMRLRIQDDFQLNIVTEAFDDDDLFVDGKGVASYVEDCQTASFHWFPERQYNEGRFIKKSFHKSGRLIRNCGEKIIRGKDSWQQFGKHVDKHAQYTLHAPDVPVVYYNSMRTLLHKGACDPKKHFYVELIRRFDLKIHPPYARKRPVPVPGLSPLRANPHGIRGWAFEMQNSRGSILGNEYRQTDWEVAIPLKRSPEVFRFLRKFMNGEEGNEKPFPLQSVGFFIRFSKASPSLMSHAAVGGDFQENDTVMFLELSEYLPIFDAKTDREREIADAIMDEYERPFRAFVTELVTRFDARVHWAKNRPELFKLQLTKRDRKEQLGAFVRQVQYLDKDGLFSNDMTDALFIEEQRSKFREKY